MLLSKVPRLQKITQWLRAHTALAEDLGWVSTSYMALTLLPGVPMPSLGLYT